MSHWQQATYDPQLPRHLTCCSNCQQAHHHSITLDYDAATYPVDGTTYQASNMILTAHSDASFLSEPKLLSHAVTSIFLSEDDHTAAQ